MKNILLAGALALLAYLLFKKYTTIQYGTDNFTVSAANRPSNIIQVPNSNGRLKGWFEPTTGEYVNISDRRLKTNIQNLPSLLGKIMQLQPVEYEMRYENPGHQRSFGFIAQDVRKLFPELVTVITDTTGGFHEIPDLHALKYTGFGTLAIKAIQEQQQMISDLKKEVEDLKKLLIQSSPVAKTYYQKID